MLAAHESAHARRHHQDLRGPGDRPHVRRLRVHNLDRRARKGEQLGDRSPHDGASAHDHRPSSLQRDLVGAEQLQHRRRRGGKQRAVEGARDADVDFVTINAMSTTAAWTGMEAPGFRTVTEHIGALERFIQVVGG